MFKQWKHKRLVRKYKGRIFSEQEITYKEFSRDSKAIVQAVTEMAVIFGLAANYGLISASETRIIMNVANAANHIMRRK